jgi:membrane protein implicated in regulation of membrane protease activity
MQDALPLRDIHASVAPAWWPPAPGWWILVAFAALVLAILLAWRWRRIRRRRRHQQVFDLAVAAAGNPAEQVAVMSGLLRRAARLRDPSADRLEGDAWLAFLDADDTAPRLSAESAALLLEGPFRRDADPAAVDALRRTARARFLAWMEGRT